MTMTERKVSKAKVGLLELMEATTNIYSGTFETIPLSIVASIWYLVLTTALSIGQHFIEARYSGERTPGRAGWLMPVG
jgi:ABC-type amino acid transport system permease subunit